MVSRQALAQAGILVAEHIMARHKGVTTVKAVLAVPEDYDVIRADLVNSIFDAFIGFLSSSGSVSKWRSAAGKALVSDVPAAFERGYQDTGGQETDPEDDAWATAKQAEQIGYMADAFDSLKDWRNRENFTESDVQDRAEVWGAMLDGVYSEGRLRGSRNVMCYFGGDDGLENCDTCRKLKDGPPHSVKWILAHNLIPHPGNTEFECGSWRCQHNWFSVKTDEQVTF